MIGREPRPQRHAATDGGATVLRADAVIGALAAKQHGIVTRMQLLRAGVSRHRLDHRVKTGQLLPVHLGVYRVGPVVAPRARETAAVLACEGVLSHWTVTVLWNMVPPRPRSPWT